MLVGGVVEVEGVAGAEDAEGMDQVLTPPGWTGSLQCNVEVCTGSVEMMPKLSITLGLQGTWLSE